MDSLHGPMMNRIPKWLQRLPGLTGFATLLASAERKKTFEVELISIYLIQECAICGCSWARGGLRSLPCVSFGS